MVGLASILVDVTVAVPALPPRGGDVLATGTSSAAGGGLNALVAAARLGLPACYAGRHGTGAHGDLVRRTLAAEGITALAEPSADGDTGWCLAFVEPDGERTFVTLPGTESRLERDTLAGYRPAPGDVVYLSGYDLLYPVSGPVLAAWVAELPALTEGGPWVCLDPGPLIGQVPGDRLAAVLPRVHLLSAGAAELAVLPGSAGLTKGGCLVLERRGAAGAVLRWDGGELVVPAVTPPGPVIDTNGAGDAFLGALLAGLGDGWRAALDLAGRAAAWSLTRPGAASGPTRAELGAS